ncbi:MAG: flagellar hook protein FlgE, partial [Gammaproteobacteria bacterium]
MAFQTAVSGLNAATAALDVAGNNIANASTTGFKTSRAQFADVFATSSLGTTSDTAGQGVKVSSVSQQFNQGNIAFTDSAMDLAISGRGFFVLETPAGEQTYTRAGEFGVDKDGFIVNPTGDRLVTFQASGGAVTGALGALQLSTANISPQPTGQVTVGVNLNSEASIPTLAFDSGLATSFNNSTSTTVFDSLGAEHLATVFFRKTAATTWDTHMTVDNDNAQTTTTRTLTFDNAGQLLTAMPVDYGTFTPTNGAAPMFMNFDLTDSTQLSAEFGVNQLSQNGFTTGRLSGVEIDSSGVVLARFSNGEVQAQGQVALANFSNSQGLQPMGNTAWAETSASGTALVGAPGSASLGLMQSGSLEDSNTDLAQQLVDVIIAQRNFQSSAQMIE